jgi:hypothetical protein
VQWHLRTADTDTTALSGCGGVCIPQILMLQHRSGCSGVCVPQTRTLQHCPGAVASAYRRHGHYSIVQVQWRYADLDTTALSGVFCMPRPHPGALPHLEACMHGTWQIFPAFIRCDRFSALVCMFAPSFLPDVGVVCAAVGWQDC